MKKHWFLWLIILIFSSISLYAFEERIATKVHMPARINLLECENLANNRIGQPLKTYNCPVDITVWWEEEIIDECVLTARDDKNIFFFKSNPLNEYIVNRIVEDPELTQKKILVTVPLKYNQSGTYKLNYFLECDFWANAYDFETKNVDILDDSPYTQVLMLVESNNYLKSQNEILVNSLAELQRQGNESNVQFEISNNNSRAANWIALVGIIAAIGAAYLIYKNEKKDKKEDDKKNQIEILKALIHDMNQNLGHVNSFGDTFHEQIDTMKKSLKKLRKNSKIRKSLLLQLSKLEKFEKRTISYYHELTVFMDLVKKIPQTKIPFNWLPVKIFTFNLHQDILNYVIQNFRQFNFSEFENLRTKLLEVRHIYDVYITGVSYLFNKDGNAPQYRLCSNNMYYFLHHFSDKTNILLDELLKNPELKEYFDTQQSELEGLHYIHN